MAASAGMMRSEISPEWRIFLPPRFCAHGDGQKCAQRREIVKVVETGARRGFLSALGNV